MLDVKNPTPVLKTSTLFIDFYNAILVNNIKTAKSCLEKDKRLLTLKNEWGDTLFHHFCRYVEPSLEMINLFFENGLDPNIKNLEGKTALYYALFNPNITIPIIKALLNKKAELDCKHTMLILTNINNDMYSVYDTNILCHINDIFPPLTEEKNTNNKRPMSKGQDLNL